MVSVFPAIGCALCMGRRQAGTVTLSTRKTSCRDGYSRQGTRGEIFLLGDFEALVRELRGGGAGGERGDPSRGTPEEGVGTLGAEMGLECKEAGDDYGFG